MSDAKWKRPRNDQTGPISPLQPRPRINTGAFVPWRTVPSRDGEAVRWQCIDGRWVSVSLGDGERAGQAKVCDSTGRCEYVDGFDAALELAEKWRTV